MSHRDEYRQWPFLTKEEFNLVCAFFDQRYIRAKLGPTRKIFKINSRRSLMTGNSYIEIIRLLHLPKDQDDLSLALEKLSGGGEKYPVKDIEMEMEMDTADEDGDFEALRSELAVPPQYSLYSHQPYVTYEIHLHPAYRMPTLWFTLHDLPMGEPTFDLNSVYRYLVPDEYKSNLRAIGVAGGISAAPHPVTDLPAFFIHPCQTKEALEDFDCPMTDYLMAWLGVVGGCVGLWVPPEMAMENINQ